MAFETFTGRGRKASSVPKVTISKTGLISANKVCREKLLGGTDAVQLLYDRKTKRIGIKPVPKGTPHAYRFHAEKGGQISGSAFLKHYDIMPDKTKSLQAKWDDETAAVVCTVK